MNASDGLVYAYIFDGKGGGTPLDWQGISEWRPEQGLLWIHIDSKDGNARAWLARQSGVGPLTCQSLLDQETRPRSTSTDDGLIAILRGVNCNPGEDPEDMVAIRMLLTEQRIVTIRYRRVMALQDVHEAINAGKGPINAGQFFVMVARRITDRLGDIVSELDDGVDALEDSLLSSENQALRPQLADVRRKTIGLRRYIAPQKNVLAHLLYDQIPWLSDTDRAHLREIAEQTARFVEDLDATRERAAISQDEINNRLSEQMNKAMYTLSIVAAIFLPLGLLTGLLGINVGGIPGVENRWAFTYVTVGLAAIVVILVIWFKKIRWL